MYSYHFVCVLNAFNYLLVMTIYQKTFAVWQPNFGVVEICNIKSFLTTQQIALSSHQPELFLGDRNYSEILKIFNRPTIKIPLKSSRIKFLCKL